MLGSLMRYITEAEMKAFQPMKANFGILPPLQTKVKGKKLRAAAHADRSMKSLIKFIENQEFQML